MAKLNREALMHFLDSAWNTSAADVSKAVFEVLGDDIEEMSVELNADTEQFKNILGKTKTKDNGYEPSLSADPFYADPDSALYSHLRDIALDRLKGSACKTLMLEVIIEDTSDTNYLAHVREVIVKPQSYGGGTEGVNIPFDVLEDGDSVKGYVTAASVASGSPVFKEGDIPSA